MKELQLHDLSQRHRGVSLGIGTSYAEAACVCLDRHHAPSVDFKITDAGAASTGRASWSPADDSLKAAWNNDIDATEAGACALALAAIEHCRGMFAVRRAETRTGADYYLDAPSAEIVDLETSKRLEISGVDKGSASAVRTRLKQKLDQARTGASNVPAIACVVGFAALQIMVADA